MHLLSFYWGRLSRRKSIFPRDTSLDDTEPMHQLTCMVRRMAQISLFPESWVRRKLRKPKAREGWSNKLPSDSSISLHTVSRRVSVARWASKVLTSQERLTKQWRPPGFRRVVMRLGCSRPLPAGSSLLLSAVPTSHLQLFLLLE